MPDPRRNHRRLRHQTVLPLLLHVEARRLIQIAYPAHQQAIEEMRRDVAASKACQGQPFYWQDAVTLVCAKEVNQ